MRRQASRVARTPRTTPDRPRASTAGAKLGHYRLPHKNRMSTSSSLRYLTSHSTGRTIRPGLSSITWQRCFSIIC
jgi:hypothetical protein